MKKLINILLRLKSAVFIFLATILIISCNDSSDPSSVNIFTLQDDVKLGMQLDSQIINNSTEYPLLNLNSATKYMQNIVDEIIKSPDVKNKHVFNYTIKIIRTDSIVNAFAAPGGYMYVYTGLLKFMENEATLAAVLAHEIAHAERRHATKRMTKHYGVSFLLGLLLGDNPSQWEEIGANLLTGLALLKNSRDDEYEADEYSFKYLLETKWYPGGITYFLMKIDDNLGSNILKELILTHPNPEDRVAAVEQMIKDASIPAPTEENLFTSQYRQFVKTLP